MMKRLLDRHEWAVDLAAAVLCASALAQAYAVALGRPRSPAPPAMVIATDVREREWDRWGVRKVCDHAYELRRSDLSSSGVEVVTHSRLLGGAARIVPELRDGQAMGFRLYSVPPSGLLAALGFRNGDVIRAINGFGITSPERALEAYAALKAADTFVVTFERDGVTRSAEYRLR